METGGEQSRGWLGKKGREGEGSEGVKVVKGDGR